MSDSPAPIETTESATTVPPAHGPVFGVSDKIAFGVASVVAFVVYCSTLAPSVTFEYSGELLTAAHSLGVPHPPGYPIWTILAWIWQWIIPFGNIAWRVNLMSSFFGALTVGLTALLISSSGRAMAARCGFMQRIGDERLVHLIVLASSGSAALMLGFSPVMWSQSVITEVYTLNACFLMATLALLYRWSFETERHGRLYLAAFLWGMSLTNHQTLVLLAVAFPMFVWFADRKLGRDVLAPVLAVIVLGVLKLIVTPHSLFKQGTFSAAWIFAHGIGAGVWLYYLWKEGPAFMRLWRPVLTIYGAVILGMSLYAYVPFASATNPPANWGDTRTLAAFVHHIATGQYERVHPERTPLQLWSQVNVFFDDLKSQFTIVYALIALVALFFYRDLAREDRHWLLFLLIAFLFLGLEFIYFSNQTFDKQKQFTDRVSFLPCHCLYTLWIGYGLILGCGHLVSEKPALRAAGVPISLLIFVLPIAPLIMNWATNEERGHDFGYQFGYLMFTPGGNYPALDNDAILFGGTDQGLFVPTYMIFVESQVPPRAKTTMAKYPGSGGFDRRDVYIITQNALADERYTASIRDRYGAGRPDPGNPDTLKDRSTFQRALLDFAWQHLGRDRAYPREPIWTPGDDDLQAAIRKYIDELRMRQPTPGEEVKIENGHVSLQGIASVMAVNDYVAWAIFDHNKGQHAFYVEESYAIPWMYPYMEPYGIILKVNKDPIPGITSEMIARDTTYWNALVEELHTNPYFLHDDVAQETFSKSRAAIGGLYAFRHLMAEAEHAYQQAIALCPAGPEGNLRLAQFYVELGKFDDGITVLREYRKHDLYNARIPEAINAIQKLKLQSGEQQDLEQQHAAQPDSLPIALQLIDSYAKHRRVDVMDAVVASVLPRSDLTAEAFLQIAQDYITLGRLDRTVEVLTAMTQRYPQNQIAWYNLAVVESARKNCAEAVEALRHAVSVGDGRQRVFDTLQHDPRLDNCRQSPQFQQFLAQPSALPPAPVTLPGGITISH
jgi:tetratricopeptide (TPR) repeat protein